MDSAKLNNWIQVVGIFALVASLVFVGLQLKQSQDIALSQASQARTATTVEMIINSAENAHFVSASAKKRSLSNEEFTAEEQAAMGQYATAILFLYEDQHFQFSNGFLPEERWQAAKATLKDFLGGARALPVRSAYERLPERYSSSFQAVVDELISEIDSSRRSD